MLNEKKNTSSVISVTIFKYLTCLFKLRSKVEKIMRYKSMFFFKVVVKISPDLVNKKFTGTSLVVQWLRIHPCNAEGVGAIPD